jgi:hypothetical protein
MSSRSFLQQIPFELKQFPNWVEWKLIERGGKSTKPPFIAGTGAYASSTDPSTWTDFDTASTLCPELNGKQGLGFVLGGKAIEARIVGVDIDGCRNPQTGAIAPWADEIIDLLDSYSEFTPSGFGIRVWVKGTLPTAENVFNLNPTVGFGNKVKIEVFSRDRFFTVTGKPLFEGPCLIEERDLINLYEKCREIKNNFPAPKSLVGSTSTNEMSEGVKIEQAGTTITNKLELLQTGQIVSEEPDFVIEDSFGNSLKYASHSEADLALCTQLALKYGNDSDRIAAEFAKSSLYREKWNRADYSKGTIEKGIKTAEQLSLRAAGQRVGKSQLSPAASLAASPDVSKWRDCFRSVGELEQGEIRMLITGFLPEGTTFLGALSSSAKTLIALSICKALTTGSQLFGSFDFRAPEIVPCLYLIPESGGRAFRTRCEQFRIPNDPGLFLCRTISEGVPLRLSNPFLLEAVKNIKPLVVLDTAIRFSESEDEKSATENKQLVDDILFLRAAGAVGVLGIHHSTKASGGEEMTLENTLRGTGDLGAMCDTVYAIRKDNVLYNGGSGPLEVEIRNVKPRDFVPPPPFRIAATHRKAGNILPISYINETGDFQIVKPGETLRIQTDRIKQLVSENPTITIKSVIGQSGLKKYQVEAELANLGLQKPRGTPKGGARWAHLVTADSSAEQEVDLDSTANVAAEAGR